MRERVQQGAARQREKQQAKASRAKELLERQKREQAERDRAAQERLEAQPPPVIPIPFRPLHYSGKPEALEARMYRRGRVPAAPARVTALDIQSNRRSALPAALPNRTFGLSNPDSSQGAWSDARSRSALRRGRPGQDNRSGPGS